MRKLLVLAGPSAIGKSYTARTLVESFPDDFAYAPVHTTRPRRTVENRAAERIFVSDEVFRRMAQDGAFFAHEAFAGFFYGYSMEHLRPTDKHLVIDISPYLLPGLTQHSDVVFVGMQAPPSFRELSEERMIERGDSDKIRDARHPFIERDIRDLDTLRPLIDQYGKLFYVQDNDTVPSQIIPWVRQTLNL
jgi:guanylate kinase